MRLHDSFVVVLQVQWQEIVLQEELELVHEEIRLLLSLRFRESEVEVDLLALLQRLHRHSN